MLIASRGIFGGVLEGPVIYVVEILKDIDHSSLNSQPLFGSYPGSLAHSRKALSNNNFLNFSPKARQARSFI